MKTNKLIAMLLVAIMVLSLMPVSAFAGQFTPDGTELELPDAGVEEEVVIHDPTYDGTNSVLYGAVKGATFTNGDGIYLRATEAFGSYMFVYFGADGTIYDFEDLKNVVLDKTTTENRTITMEFHCEGCQSTFTVIRVPGELFSYITTVIVNSEMSRYNGTYSQTDDIEWELFDSRTTPFKKDFSKIRNSTFLDPVPTEMGNRVLYASDMVSSGGFSCIVLESYFPEPDPDTFFPEGKYEIRNTAGTNVFRASTGIVNGKITGSYAGKINRSGSISTPVWLIESGSVTVEKVAAHTVRLRVEAINSAGMAVSSTLLFEYRVPQSFDMSVFLYDAEKREDGTYRYWFANEKNDMYFSVGALPAKTDGVTHLSFDDLDNPYCIIQASSLYTSGQEYFAAADITMEEDPAAGTVSMDMTITGATQGDVFHLTYEGISAELYLEYANQRRGAQSELNNTMGIIDSPVAMDLLFRGTMAIRSAKNTDEINAAKEQYLGMIERFLKGKDPYHVHTLTHFDAVEATCTDTGNIEYWFCEGCGEYYSGADAVNEISTDELAANYIEAAKGHTYGDPEAKWEGDMCTATRTCTVCAEGTENHSISETKQGTYVKDTDATCLAAETGHYEVTFDDAQFGSAQTDANTVSNGNPIEHSYTGAVKANGDGTHSFLCVNGCGEYGGTEKCVDGNHDGKCEKCGQADPSVVVDPVKPSKDEPAKKSFFDKIGDFFKKISDWFKKLFSFLH